MLPGRTSTAFREAHTFKAPGVARPRQSCIGIAEAALQQHLIKATEQQGSRAATSQLYWLLSGRPPSLSDNARPPPQRLARQPGQTCRSKKYCRQACPDSRFTYLIKAGAIWTFGMCVPLPNCREGHTGDENGHESGPDGQGILDDQTGRKQHCGARLYSLDGKH